MDIFVTGATGYIGGSICSGLKAEGHRVRGLVRTEEKAARLAEFGVEPVLGSLDDGQVLVREARRSDAVISAASSDHRGSLEAIIEGLAGSGKPFLHTSGSSVIADEACGEWASEVVFDETTPLVVPEARADRAAIDRMVLDAAKRGVRSAVLCNTMIYGEGMGLEPDSAQIPLLMEYARKTGVVRHVGRGLNIWSNVHIEDVVALYLHAVDRAPAGAFYFVENGEASFAEIAGAIARRLSLGSPEAWPIEEAAREWGRAKRSIRSGRIAVSEEREHGRS